MTAIELRPRCPKCKQILFMEIAGQDHWGRVYCIVCGWAVWRDPDVVIEGIPPICPPPKKTPCEGRGRYQVKPEYYREKKRLSRKRLKLKETLRG